MKIYLASSWRNPAQEQTLHALRDSGFVVYDFKNPAPDNKGFSWSATGVRLNEEGKCSPMHLEGGLRRHKAQLGFKYDFDAMKAADACVLLLPSGRSAHLEAGWMAGAGKPVFVYAPAPVAAMIEPELMYLCLDKEIITEFDSLRARLNEAVLYAFRRAK